MSHIIPGLILGFRSVRDTVQDCVIDCVIDLGEHGCVVATGACLRDILSHRYSRFPEQGDREYCVPFDGRAIYPEGDYEDHSTPVDALRELEGRCERGGRDTGTYIRLVPRTVLLGRAGVYALVQRPGPLGDQGRPRQPVYSVYRVYKTPSGPVTPTGPAFGAVQDLDGAWVIEPKELPATPTMGFELYEAAMKYVKRYGSYQEARRTLVATLADRIAAVSTAADSGRGTRTSPRAPSASVKTLAERIAARQAELNKLHEKDQKHRMEADND